MHRTKLSACLAAAMVTMVGATYLAQPAAAQPGNCSSTQLAYARGFADGSCPKGGTVDSCTDNGNGGFTFSWTCIQEM